MIDIMTMMKRLVCYVSMLLTALTIGACAEKEADPKEEYDVYLLIGQSNMAGRGEITEEDKTFIPNVFILDSEGKPVPATNPLNIYSTIRKEDRHQKMGPGAFFARTVAERTGHKVLLVVNARGGSSINAWKKGEISDVKVGNSSSSVQISFYEEAIRRARQAMEYGTLKGILWHQGCQDLKDQEYMTKLTSLVNDLREDLGSDVPFVAGQLGRWRTSVADFNERITTISEYLTKSDWVSSEGGEPIVDSNGQPDMTDPHFNRESQKLMGERYAQKILTFVYGK